MPFQRAPTDGPTNEPSAANPSDNVVPNTSRAAVSTTSPGANETRAFGLPDASVNTPAATVTVPAPANPDAGVNVAV